MNSDCSANNECPTRAMIHKCNLESYIHYIYRSLIWENWIGFGILAVIVLIDFIFIRKTNLATLSYLCLLALELYWIDYVMKMLKLVGPEGQGKDDVEAIDKMLEPAQKVKCLVQKSLENEYVKKVMSTPIYVPLCISAIALVFVLFAEIFCGPFLSIVAILCIFTIPGIVHRNYHKMAAEQFKTQVWPKIQPLYEAHIQPQIEKVFKKKGSESASSSAASESPAPETKAPETQTPQQEEAAPAPAPEKTEETKPEETKPEETKPEETAAPAEAPKEETPAAEEEKPKEE
ncbi:uncharacterized protein MONOS_12947 [Monocercomonoides exilis]|uniref:uncharacterized protein n=1 Tax=Monocercomonoides exilis TaxID=2049356 RepID=UPI003559CF2B|nr:hypothetical protein MONOS_12947 [Monocercomonoides exilis]|eukprot:MONOS_12947.1-p1 / transcript=MONOS_12947.1 / gene=MONOS_12947 / organism=Monocercomonoides_exilis_PA203 / gene_product=unspecified product / transcript_product=unspecified product / location=Mono_scaffold00757:13674-14653(+) / protein_length=290 / sequence_SO=supercontig / SO=protein_coding / is_pseudo=false